MLIHRERGKLRTGRFRPELACSEELFVSTKHLIDPKASLSPLGTIEILTRLVIA